MSVSIVNGYVCFNCTDTERAQKGQDPAKSTSDPAKETSGIKALTDPSAPGASAVAASGDVSSWSAYAAPGNDGSPDPAAGASSPQQALLPPGLGGAVDVFA